MIENDSKGCDASLDSSEAVISETDIPCCFVTGSNLDNLHVGDHLEVRCLSGISPFDVEFSVNGGTAQHLLVSSSGAMLRLDRAGSYEFLSVTDGNRCVGNVVYPSCDDSTARRARFSVTSYAVADLSCAEPFLCAGSAATISVSVHGVKEEPCANLFFAPLLTTKNRAFLLGLLNCMVLKMFPSCTSLSVPGRAFWFLLLVIFVLAG